MHFCCRCLLIWPGRPRGHPHDQLARNHLGTSSCESTCPALETVPLESVAHALPAADHGRYPQGQHENRIYELKMECGPNYPKEPPVFHFVSQINLPGVNQHDGRVDQNAVAILRDWERIATELSKNPRPKEDPLSLEAALIAIRKSVNPSST